MQPIVVNEDLVFDTQVALHGGEAELATHLLRLVQLLLKIWLSLTPRDILVQKVTTAMTNYVFRVTASVQESMSEEDCASPLLVEQPEDLLVRVYGDAEWMFNRRNELAAAQVLAEGHLIPPWHGIFGNGRVEHFILSQQTTASEFRSLAFAKNIVANLAHIHAKLQEIIPVTSWEPGVDYLWERLGLWRERAVEALDHLRAQPLESKHKMMLKEIERWDPLNVKLHDDLQQAAVAADSPLVFAHCDVHHGNVLRKIGTTEVIIIDPEYGIPTSRGADLANFFGEFCADYNSVDRWKLDNTKYPTDAVMTEILHTYLQNSSIGSVSDISQVKDEIRAYLPLVQLLWGHWSLVQASKVASKSMVIYLEFAHQRYIRFRETAHLE